MENIEFIKNLFIKPKYRTIKWLRKYNSWPSTYKTDFIKFLLKLEFWTILIYKISIGYRANFYINEMYNSNYKSYVFIVLGLPNKLPG